MRYVGIPAVVSTSAAPFGLIGGWALAAYMWPEYDPIRQTISELAAGDAPTAVMMNAMFVLAGICHLTSAVFLYAVAIPGRAILAVGGLASIALAWFPLPTVDSTTTAHRVVAGISFIACHLAGIRLAASTCVAIALSVPDDSRDCCHARALRMVLPCVG